VREHVHVTPIEKIKIVPAQLGTDAGLIGAAVWASLQLRSGRALQATSER